VSSSKTLKKKNCNSLAHKLLICQKEKAQAFDYLENKLFFTGRREQA